MSTGNKAEMMLCWEEVNEGDQQQQRNSPPPLVAIPTPTLADCCVFKENKEINKTPKKRGKKVEDTRGRRATSVGKSY